MEHAVSLQLTLPRPMASSLGTARNPNRPPFCLRQRTKRLSGRFEHLHSVFLECRTGLLQLWRKLVDGWMFRKQIPVGALGGCLGDIWIAMDHLTFSNRNQEALQGLRIGISGFEWDRDLHIARSGPRFDLFLPLSARVALTA